MKLACFFVVPLVGARVVRTQAQIPIVGQVGYVETEIVQSSAQDSTEGIAPSIGVHFTTSYAVAAARYENGTTRDLVRVTGDAEYNDMMSRWTVWEKDTKSFYCHQYARNLTTFEVMMQRYKCNMRFLGRSSRRLLGLPTTRDAGILSVFMKRVRKGIETELGTTITSIAPAFPLVTPYANEDIQEALALVGLTSTRTATNHGDTQAYDETNAAYAGLGFGLCEAWTNYKGCASKERPKRPEVVIFFNFDNSSFRVGAMAPYNAFEPFTAYYYGMDTELGWWNLPVFEVPRAKFWAQIHEKILDVFANMPMPPNKIMLMGEHGADPEFKEVVKAAMWEKFEFDVELMLEASKMEDVGKLAARGAAELGWRNEDLKRQWDALRHESEMARDL